MRDQVDLSAQLAVLEHLRDQMEQAKALFEGAKDEYDRQLRRMQEPGLTHPDERMRHATKVYQFTLELYWKALWQYNRFVLDGRPPDQGFDSKRPEEGADSELSRDSRV